MQTAIRMWLRRLTDLEEFATVKRSRRFFQTLSATTVLAAVSIALPGVARAEFFKVDFPGFNLQTEAYLINNRNQVSGYYIGTECSYPHWSCVFLREPDGSFVSLSVPGFENTVPGGLNDSGVIVGQADHDMNDVHGTVGFVYDHGTFTTFSAPGAIATGFGGINAGGTILGYFIDVNVHYHYFVKAPGGALTEIAVPNGNPIAINDAGQVLGYLTSVSFQDEGFLREADGKITVFQGPNGSGIYPTALSQKGTVTGDVVETNPRHVVGFVRDHVGNITTFEAIPGSPPLSGTDTAGINDSGEIAGGFRTAKGVLFGFTRDISGAVSLFRFQKKNTIPKALNSAGWIVGIYVDANYDIHGFLARK